MKDDKKENTVHSHSKYVLNFLQALSSQSDQVSSKVCVACFDLNGLVQDYNHTHPTLSDSIHISKSSWLLLLRWLSAKVKAC